MAKTKSKPRRAAPPKAAPVAGPVEPERFPMIRDKKKDVTEDGDHIVRNLMYHRKKMQWSMDGRLERLRQFMGYRGGESTTGDKTPLNPMRMALLVYMQRLTVHRPQISVSAPRRSQAMFSKHWEMTTNEVLRRIQFGRELASGLLEAMFSMGAFLCGMEAMPGDDYDDEYFPFVRSIDFSNLILDMNAESLHTQQFYAWRFQIPVDAAMEGDYFDDEAKGIIWKNRGSDADMYSQNMTDSRRLANTDRQNVRTEMRETFSGWNTWLPWKKKIVTTMGNTSHVIKRSDYDKNLPACGPLKFLTLSGVLENSGVPGNVLPISPSQDLFDLSDSSDRLLNKLVRDGERSKEVTLVDRGAREDGETVRDAANGDMISVDDPNNVKSVIFGGVNQQVYALFQEMRALNSYKGGNIDVLGGLSQEADTARQEEQLDRNSSESIRAMVRSVNAAIEQVGEHVGTYVWYDKMGFVKNLRYEDQKLASVGIDIQATDFTKLTDRGNLKDQNFIVTPYVLRDITPAEKQKALTETVAEIMQAGPLAQQQGLFPDLVEYFNLKARLSGVPEIHQIVRSQQPEEAPPPAQGGGKPSETKRTYERINKSGYSPKQASQVRANLMLGQNVQQKEKNGI